MEETKMLRKTLIWTGALLGISTLWVGMLSLTSVLVVSAVLPQSTPAVTTPATPAPKPASSDAPSRPGSSHEDTPGKRRNG
jgi:hypothetical protein